MSLFIILFNLHPITVYPESDGIKKFFSTKYDEVNIRNGPGKNYYVIGKHFKKGLPVLVVNEFDGWKRIINFLGKEGWVSNSQLSKKRFGITKKKTFLKSFPKSDSTNQFLLGKHLNFKIIKCLKEWCKTKIKKTNGWIRKDSFWGVFKDEEF